MTVPGGVHACNPENGGCFYEPKGHLAERNTALASISKCAQRGGGVQEFIVYSERKQTCISNINFCEAGAGIMISGRTEIPYPEDTNTVMALSEPQKYHPKLCRANFAKPCTFDIAPGTLYH